MYSCICTHRKLSLLQAQTQSQDAKDSKFNWNSCQGWRKSRTRLHQCALGWAWTQELNTTRLQVVDTALDLHLSCGDLLLDQLAVLQKEVNGVEHVQLDGLVHNLRFGRSSAQLFRSLLGHVAETHQQGIQRFGDLWFVARLGLQVCGRGTLDGSAGSVPKHQHHLGVQRRNTELQAAHNAAFGMSAGVASIAEHEDVARHSIKDCLQRCTRVGAADDGCQGRLTLLDQSSSHTIGDIT
mmetsp:Transcript_103947/g.144652  ORF Transcript_103947/g.144652 Transcript_103947/m.144652 type:complete len:239 (-) Transcript_103947:473-1189(-)